MNKSALELLEPLAWKQACSVLRGQGGREAPALPDAEKMADYTPNVSKEDIDRIIRRDYPQISQEEVWAMLRGYGSGEAFRIYAAALKEGGGNLDDLAKAIELANLDYRDLLMAAEYPAQGKLGFSASPSPETIKADSEQYHQWFNREDRIGSP